MKKPPVSRLADLAVNALFIAVAGACGIFAGYMVIRLNGMENPPANMGLNFPPAQKKVITDDSIAVDRLTTQSTESPKDSPGPFARPLQPYSRLSPVIEHRLLAVVDGLAFVEVRRVTGKEIVMLNKGGELPGAGPVEWIERIDGRWQIKAGDTLLTAGRR